METLIITNNNKVHEKYKDIMPIYLSEDGYIEVLYETRDKIHEGFVLLTHPMAGSLKPNQTPYKSIMLCEGEKNKLDFESLNLIENAIASAKKFLAIKSAPDWPENILNDFKTVDLSIIESAINNPILKM